MMMLFSDDPLVKWLNTPPSQGGIHGFETHTGYQVISRIVFTILFLTYPFTVYEKRVILSIRTNWEDSYERDTKKIKICATK